MNDPIDIERERFARGRVRDFLKLLCCDPLQFMYDNSVIEPRDEWFDGEDARDRLVHARCLLGFRVVRDFWCLHRHEILYRCPFCTSELVLPLGFLSEGPWLALNPEALGRRAPVLRPSDAVLRRELALTKKRCHGRWPPKD